MKTLEQNEVTTVTRLYSTVNQFVERHPAFTIGGLRHQIFHENENGLAKSGAIIRNGRKILIKESAYFAWLENQNKTGK